MQSYIKWKWTNCRRLQYDNRRKRGMQHDKANADRQRFGYEKRKKAEELLLEARTVLYQGCHACTVCKFCDADLWSLHG